MTDAAAPGAHLQALIAQAERTKHFRHSVDAAAAVRARAQATALLQPRLPALREAAGLSADPGPHPRREGRRLARAAGRAAQTADLPVYTFWNTSIDQAPPLVRACLARLRALHPDARILDGTTARELVDIPDVIAERLEADRVAHFSDYVRVAVLDRHGGVWVDATTYLPAPVTEPARALLGAGAVYPRWTPRQIGNWFIAAVPGTPLLALQRHALQAWWGERADLPDYFLFHRLFETLVTLVPEVRGQWDVVPRLSAAACHLLQLTMMHPWHPETVAALLAAAPAQKLSYKYDAVPPGSVLERLISGDPLT